MSSAGGEGGGQQAPLDSVLPQNQKEKDSTFRRPRAHDQAKSLKCSRLQVRVRSETRYPRGRSLAAVRTSTSSPLLLGVHRVCERHIQRVIVLNQRRVLVVKYEFF